METVSQMRAKVFNNQYVCQLDIGYEGGKIDGVTGSIITVGDMLTEEIPSDHVIIGVYGKLHTSTLAKRIPALGFITIDVAVFN